MRKSFAVIEETPDLHTCSTGSHKLRRDLTVKMIAKLPNTANYDSRNGSAFDQHKVKS